MLLIMRELSELSFEPASLPVDDLAVAERGLAYGSLRAFLQPYDNRMPTPQGHDTFSGFIVDSAQEFADNPTRGRLEHDYLMRASFTRGFVTAGMPACLLGDYTYDHLRRLGREVPYKTDIARAIAHFGLGVELAFGTNPRRYQSVSRDFFMKAS